MLELLVQQIHSRHAWARNVWVPDLYGGLPVSWVLEYLENQRQVEQPR